MKRYLYTFFVLAVFSCKDEEETYPIEPQITLTDLKVGQGSSSPQLPDTVTIIMSYTDGDGDFGFNFDDEADLLPPYQRGFFYLKSTGEPVTSDRVMNYEVPMSALIRLSDRQAPPYDTLPDLYERLCSYNAPPGFGMDPAYFTRNENHVNIMVEVLYEDINGVFVEFDRENKYCNWLDGRVPMAGQEFEPYFVRKGTARKGELSYRVINVDFSILLKGKRIKLRVSVRDRALHNSNVVETEPISL